MSSLFAADPEQFLPPLLPWHGTSESLVVPPDDPWITPGELSQLTESPNYASSIAYLEKLVAGCPLFSLQEIGRSAQGRPLYLVLATKEDIRTPAALSATGKPIVFVQAGIHPGEIDGKDAGLMLLRDIAFRGKAALLDGVHLLFVPVLNPDGHERSSKWSRPNQRGPVHMGWRTNAQNLNLNRDFPKLDAPETRAVVALFNTWQPSLQLDLHVTDGLDYQYDVSYSYNGWRGEPAYSPHIAAWLDTVFDPHVDAALKQQGHVPINFYVEACNDRDLEDGLTIKTSQPRFCQGYGDIRHMASVLVETHSLKTHRQRVLGTYVLLESTLVLLNRESAGLIKAIAADKATRAPLPARWKQSDEKRDFDFLGITCEHYLSPASGAREVRWTGQPKLHQNVPLYGSVATKSLARPTAFWVPVTKPDVIERVKLHGIVFETLTAPRTLTLEMRRLVNPQPRPGEGFHPFEGRHTLSTDSKAETRTEMFPAGSIRVPTDQPLGDLAILLLDPDSEDSLVCWGFFSEILKRTEYMEGYVIAPLAEKMLANSPALKAEFEARLQTEPAFAADPMARLEWFYARTPFYDDRYLLYPVGIER